jgi:hypothetical protein
MNRSITGARGIHQALQAGPNLPAELSVEKFGAAFSVAAEAMQIERRGSKRMDRLQGMATGGKT